MTDDIFRILQCYRCEGSAFLYAGPFTGVSQSKLARHLDGSAMLPFTIICCDTCGRGLDLSLLAQFNTMAVEQIIKKPPIREGEGAEE